MKIAINGAGVAGPTLAYWLTKGGHDVLLVEEAPQLRSGGYVIDFWGIGYDIAEKMGLIPRIRELGYQIKEVRFVNDKGKKSGGFDTDVFVRMTNGRFTSVRRSDISSAIFSLTEGKIETRFGDSIAAIDDSEEKIRINFDYEKPRDVDLVVGSDGLHSRIRSLVFGKEEQFEKPLGYHVAAFEVNGYQPRDELVYVSYALPGRQVSRFSMRDDKTLFLFVFRNEYLTGDQPSSLAERKALLAAMFANAGWECPKILKAMEHVDDIYFDSVSQIRMDRWSKGRTVLIGDAAACVSLLAGEGTGLAMGEAYILAGELNRCGEDYTRAFERYQSLMMPFIRQKQASAAKFASSFVPATALGISFRNLVTRLMNIPWIANYFIGQDLRDNIDLPNY